MPTIDNWLALREALEAGPTEGQWTLELVEDRSIKHLCPVDADGLSILTVVTHDETPFAAVYLDKDAAYIAAANPATIRALLAERDRLAAEVEALRGDAERYRWLRQNPTWLGWDADFRPDEVEREVDAARGKPAQHCTYPDCRCPFDAPADPNWCAKGLPQNTEGKRA